MVTEQRLLEAVRDACRWTALLAYHTHDSRRSEPGLPDLVIVGPDGLLFRELKGERGRTAAAQRRWLCQHTEAGAAADIWRPCDWPDRVFAELAGIGARGLRASGAGAS